MGQPDHPIEYLPARNEVQFAYSDHSKMAHAFQHRPQTPLAEGLRRMARWALAAGIQYLRPFHAIEVQRNLPPSWQRLFVPSDPARP